MAVRDVFPKDVTFSRAREKAVGMERCGKRVVGGAASRLTPSPRLSEPKWT